MEPVKIVQAIQDHKEMERYVKQMSVMIDKNYLKMAHVLIVQIMRELT